MPVSDIYHQIALQKATAILPVAQSATNQQLRSFIDSCFEGAMEPFRLYACWVCVECLPKGAPTFGWGKKPRKCSVCNSSNIYQVATFNAWAPVVGNVFTAAVYYLMRHQFRIPIFETPGNTTTHDFEVTSSIAVEAKGSPTHILNPDGSRYELGRPGMERTDSEKKAFANAQKFRQRNRSSYFCILTNALPPRLLNYRGDAVNGVFNVTRREEVEVFVRDLREHVDLDALREREFGHA